MILALVLRPALLSCNINGHWKQASKMRLDCFWAFGLFSIWIIFITKEAGHVWNTSHHIRTGGIPSINILYRPWSTPWIRKSPLESLTSQCLYSLHKLSAHLNSSPWVISFICVVRFNKNGSNRKCKVMLMGSLGRKGQWDLWWQQ